jgi:hypothetical protein
MHATHITTRNTSMQQIMEMPVEMKEDRKAGPEKMAADK